VTAVTAVKPHQ